MKKMKCFVMLLLVVLAVSPVSAQKNKRNYEAYPYTFVGVQGGAQVTFSNPSFKNLVTPVGAISVGRFFTPVVGGRINVSGWKNKSGYILDGSDKTYDFNYLTYDLDLLVNFSNIFNHEVPHPLNLMLVAGVGVAHASGNNEQLSIVNTAGIREPLAWSSNRVTHNFRIGMQLEANVAKHWGVNLEVIANHMGDSFNGKKNGHPDWQAVALLGVTYKFGLGKKDRSTANQALALQNFDASRSANAGNAQAPVAEHKPAPKPEAKPTPKPEVKAEPKPKAPEKINVEVSYGLGNSTVTASEEAKVRDLAQWLKTHPNARVYVTGYADKGTGTAAINMKVSKQRAQGVANMLTKKYGIDSSRIVVEAKGDTVQPYSENDLNRVVISTAEE